MCQLAPRPGAIASTEEVNMTRARHRRHEDGDGPRRGPVVHLVLTLINVVVKVLEWVDDDDGWWWW